jgi:hypothetical protein
VLYVQFSFYLFTGFHLCYSQELATLLHKILTEKSSSGTASQAVQTLSTPGAAAATAVGPGDASASSSSQRNVWYDYITDNSNAYPIMSHHISQLEDDTAPITLQSGTPAVPNLEDYADDQRWIHASSQSNSELLQQLHQDLSVHNPHYHRHTGPYLGPTLLIGASYSGNDSDDD